MTLLKPMMWAGALLGAVPVIIHLLNRSRFRVEPFGAVMFLRAAVHARSRALKWQQLSLLLLRVLFFVLLAAALSRPVTRFGPATAGAQPTTHVLIIDGSRSMRQGQGTANAFAMARRSALRILENMESYDNMTVIWGGCRPRPLLPAPSFDRVRLRKIITGLQAGDASFDVPQALAQAYWALEQSTLPRHRIYVLSDGQATGWRLTADSDWQRLRKQRELLKLRPAAYVLQQAPKQPPANVAPVRIALQAPLLDTLRQAAFTAELINHSRAPRRVTILFAVDGRQVREHEMTLAPGPDAAHFHHRFTRPGSHYLTVSVRGDEFAADNALTRAVHVLRSIPVLLIEGHQDDNPFVGSATLFRSALEATGEPDETGLFQVTTRDQTDADTFDMAYLQHFRCVVLADVPTLSQHFTFVLEQFAETGGGVFIALGPRVVPLAYNAVARQGNGLLPGSLSPDLPLSDGAVARPVFPAGTAGNILDIFDTTRTRILGDVRVRQYRRLVSGGAHAVVLAGVNDDPLILYKPLGRGRTLTWATSLNPDWTNFPFTRDYLPLVQNLVLYLSASVEPPVNLAPGETLLYSSRRPLSGEPAANIGRRTGPLQQPTGLLTLPDGRHETLPLTPAGNAWVGQWEDTAQAGLYTVRAPGLPPRYFAVTPTPAEADLSRLSPAQQRRVAALTDSTGVDSFTALTARIADEGGAREWWRLIAGAALLLMGVELVLAWRFSG